MNFEDFKKEYEKVPVYEYPNSVHKQPLISICIQTYQHASYIRECLDSILAQKVDFPIEILLSEDGSTDGTREICIEYAKNYPDKIRLFLHVIENNISLLGSRSGRFNFIYNIYTSNGKYLAMCEGDDYWTDPLKLRKQIDVFEKDDRYSLVVHQSLKVIETTVTDKILGISDHTGEVDTDILLAREKGIVPTASMVFKKEMVLDMPEWMNTAPVGDYYLLLLAVKFGAVFHIHEVMATRRIVAGSWTTKKKNVGWFVGQHKKHFESLDLFLIDVGFKFEDSIVKYKRKKTVELFTGYIINGVFNKESYKYNAYLRSHAKLLRWNDWYRLAKYFFSRMM